MARHGPRAIERGWDFPIHCRRTTIEVHQKWDFHKTNCLLPTMDPTVPWHLQRNGDDGRKDSVNVDSDGFRQRLSRCKPNLFPLLTWMRHLLFGVETLPFNRMYEDERQQRLRGCVECVIDLTNRSDADVHRSMDFLPSCCYPATLSLGKKAHDEE